MLKYTTYVLIVCSIVCAFLLGDSLAAGRNTLVEVSPLGLEKPANLGERDTMAETWGIEILGIRLSAAHYMLDFRYRVLDSDKASPLFKRKVKPYLLDQKSGAKFIVPSPGKVGPLRNSYKPQVGRSYVMIFANPGRYIKAGNQVTVVIGDFKATDLTVY